MSKWIIVFIVIILAVAALAYWFYFYKPSHVPVTQPTETATQETTITPTQEATTTPTQEAATSSPAISAAEKSLAKMLGVQTKSITVISVEEREWPDSCLGIPVAGKFCSEVITPGFEIVMSVNGKEYRYRTNLAGTLAEYDIGPSYK